MPDRNLKLNVLIIDDERKACTNLLNMLRDYVGADVQVTGIANDTREAESLILQHRPDAVFLDIEMPHENAFHFLDRIAPFNFEVVFVTAFDEYAIRAFKLNAVDYLLKPISIAELRDAVVKLKERVKYKKHISGPGSYTDISNQLANKVKQQKITVRDHNTVEVIDFSEIFYFEAQSSYSKVVFNREGTAREAIMSSPLSEYEELLPGDLFYRIHRSYLVNCKQVTKIENGNLNQVTIAHKFILPISRRRYAHLLEFLKSHKYHV